jgi:ligand-binding sensor domain-containing protein
MRHTVFVFLLSLSFFGGRTQTPFFQHYNLLHKRENVQVNSMLQDLEGFVWFGTTQGLFRFDGREYLRYTVADSLPDNNVTALAIDSAGRIWCGHANGKISWLAHGEVFRFEPEEGSSSERISDMLFDSKGNLWFATLNDGLYYYSRKRLYRLDEAEGMPDLYVYDIVEDTQGNIIAGTDGGLAVCTLDGKKVKVSVLNHKNGLPDNIIRKIQITNQGYVLATEDAGVIMYDAKLQTFTSVMAQWPYGSVTDLLLKDLQLWIACPQKGIVVVDLSTGITNTYSEANGSPGSVHGLMLDSEENIWVASKSGLFRTPGSAIEFVTAFGVTSEKNILAATTDLEGNLWFSNGEGLFLEKRKSDTKSDFTRPLQNSPLDKFTIISLHADRDGSIWAGLFGDGLLRIDPRNLKVTYFKNELRNGNVLNVTGKDGEIWLATLGGVTKVTSANGRFTFKNYSKADGLSSDFIYQVFIDTKNRKWFSTDGKGVDMLDDEGFHNFQEGLPSKIVYGVTEDGSGNIWANVQGNGLYVFDGQRFFKKDDSVPTRKTELHTLTTDSKGNLVVFHDDGIDIIDPVKKRVRYIGEESGLRDKIANLNSVGRNQQGTLIVGTSDGIVRFTEGSKFLSHQPLARISSARIFDQPREISAIGDLAYSDNNVTFNFVGLWYQSPGGLYFRYKLENYDRDWISTRNNAVTYSKLPPGEYMFKVRVSETENFINGEETAVPFVIHPPFWRTYWFYFISAVALGAGGYALIKYRERKLRFNNMILEARVRARTVEVQKQNDEIQAQNEEITAQAEEIKGINENLEMLVHERTADLERKNKALEEYAFINAHKLRSPVASILGLVNLLSKSNLDDDGREINRRLQQSADELDEIVHSITKAIERGEKQFPFQRKE